MRERQGISNTWLMYVVLVALMPHVNASSASETTELKPVVWKLESTSRIGEYTTTIVGSPHVAGKGRERALCFDGTSYGIFLPANPIAGWDHFTIEALIKPDGTGPDEQRFIHIQDERDSRLLLETRLTPSKE